MKRSAERGRSRAGAGRISEARRNARAPAHARHDRRDRLVRCAVLTVSDTRRGTADRGGALAEAMLARAGHAVVARGWTGDDRAAIRRAAIALLSRRDLDALIVTGGTGVAPRDVTPEALEPLVQRNLPGFGEVFRLISHREVGSRAWLSRAMAGVARGRLLVILPGAPAAVRLGLGRVLLPELSHLIRMLGRFSNPEE
jgi:molybdenum cofactor biosynthesis protein B